MDKGTWFRLPCLCCLVMKMDLLWRERLSRDSGDNHDDDAYDLGFAYECDYEDSDNDDSSVAW